jgi:hypothetical protein
MRISRPWAGEGRGVGSDDEKGRIYFEKTI